MKTNKILSLVSAMALGALSMDAFAVATIGAGTNTGAAGATVTIPVTYNRPGGDANNVFSASFRFAHTNPPITFVSFSTAGATPPTSSATACNTNGPNTLVTCTLTTNPSTAIAVGNYTLGTITYQIAPGAAAGAQALVTTVVECTDIMGNEIPGSCDAANGTITVSGGGGNVAPTIGYAPTTGTTINYTGAGTAANIVATPSGGSGNGAQATTTVGACTIAAGGSPAFPTTNINQLTFIGAAAAQNIVLPNCVPQAGGAVNATLTCPEVRNGVAVVPAPAWPLVCPQAAAPAVPPTLSFSPAANSSTIVAAGAAQIISVGCPTDGVACNGSGTGLAATARLEVLSAVYAGPASPQPTMVCAFVNEAAVPTGNNTLDFVAATADPGDIRCTCPLNTTAGADEPFTVSVFERNPASGNTTVQRFFTLVCGTPPPPPNCGTIVAANQAPGSIVALTGDGGAAVQVTALSLTGASVGVQQTATCVVSGASVGSTFTVTTAPTPLVLGTNPALAGTVSATCTNSAQTVATATVTCSFASNTLPTCVNGAPVAFTLNCPGQGQPPQPPVETVPVPSLSEQGRILLAALVLLMGLGVVGFRMRG